MFGLMAMVSWGTADFIATQAIRREGTFNTLLWSHVISMVLCISAYIVMVGDMTVTPVSLLKAGGVGVLGILAYLMFYRGLEVGETSVITPISACWVIVTLLISILVFGQSLTTVQAAGVCLAVAGAIATSFRLSDLSSTRRLARGVHYAVSTVVIAGIFYSSLDALTGRMGWFLPVVCVKAFGTLTLLAYAPIGKRSLSFPRSSVTSILLVGVLEVIAYLAFSCGVYAHYSSIVAPICAAFPMVTVVLSQRFLGERMATNQKAGIAALVCGVIILST